MRWEDKIFGKVRQDDWLAIGDVVPTRQSDPIDGLFGDEKTNNIVAKWETIAAEYQIPVMAQFHGFDTESQTTFRVPIDTHNIEKGLIKVKINQSERLRELARTGVTGDDALYNYVMDDGLRLADQVITRTKVAKNELMATGKVTINENGLDLTVDYGVPDENTLFEINFGANEDVPAQIQDIIDAGINKGVIINGLLTSRKNLSKMRAHASIQKAINGNIGVGALVSTSALYNYLSDEFGIDNVVVNDLTYGASSTIDATTGRPTVTTKRYYPDDKITFFATNPSGTLGVGLWGNPPEADATINMNVTTSNVDPYVWISQWNEKDPAVLWTKASSLFIPVLFNPNSLFIATVESGEITDLTMTADAADATYPWTALTPADFQSDVTVADGKVTGSLRFIEGGLAPSGPLAGNGYFLAVKFDNFSSGLTYTNVQVGLKPSKGTGLVTLDSDKNAVFKIDNLKQKIQAVQTKGTAKNTQYFDLSGLTLEEAQGA